MVPLAGYRRSLHIFALLLIVLLHTGCKGCTSDTRRTYTKNKIVETNSEASNENQGEVIKIVDGDTFDLLINGNTTIRIRMNGIDAPERGQAYYQKAKDFLGQICFRKNVSIKRLDKDRWGRIIADSYTEDGTSLSAEMVKNGYAWHFKKYSSDTELASLEENARNNHLGLWADPNPEKPWELRAEKRKGKGISESN